MSSIINATTTNGLKLQPDNSGSLVLQTNNGTTAVTVDTSQNTTLAGKLTTASSGIQFSDSSIQTAAASPYVLKNRIINGDMRIDQRNAGASVTPSDSQYLVDRWVFYRTQASKFTAQQNAGSVTPPAGFTNYLGFTSSSAYSVLSTDVFIVTQPIEGFNVSDLAFGTASAKTVTLSFWVRSSLTGTFGGSLYNIANNKSYTYSYTISAANTWEQKSITITGDTVTALATGNTGGISTYFNLGAGSNWQATAGTWTTGNYTTPSGTVNVVGTNGATWYITGVQLEIGTSATPFERRLYNQELVNCQRYCQVINSTTNQFGNGWFNATNIIMFLVNIPITMRTAPTLTWNGGTISYDIPGTTITSTGTSGTLPYPNIFGTNGGRLAIQLSTATQTSGSQAMVYIEGTGKLTLSSEL